MEHKIELKVHRTNRNERRCVQITGEANATLMEIYRATGLPVGHIVSQMIIQGSKFIDIIEEGEDD